MRSRGRGEGKGQLMSIATRALLVTMVVATAGASPAVAADPGLRAQWHMDGLIGGGALVDDSSGLANLLFASPIVTPISGGRFGGALSFAGGGTLSRPATAALEPQNITLMAWVRASGSPGVARYLVTKGQDSACTGSSYALETDYGGGLVFYIWDGSGLVVKSPDAGTGIWDGAWHAVAGTFDGSYVRLYVDGVKVAGEVTTRKQIGYALSGGTGPDDRGHTLLFGPALRRRPRRGPHLRPRTERRRAREASDRDRPRPARARRRRRHGHDGDDADADADSGRASGTAADEERRAAGDHLCRAGRRPCAIPLPAGDLGERTGDPAVPLQLVGQNARDDDIDGPGARQRGRPAAPPGRDRTGPDTGARRRRPHVLLPGRPGHGRRHVHGLQRRQGTDRSVRVRPAADTARLRRLPGARDRRLPDRPAQQRRAELRGARRAVRETLRSGNTDQLPPVAGRRRPDVRDDQHLHRR